MKITFYVYGYTAHSFICLVLTALCLTCYVRYIYWWRWHSKGGRSHLEYMALINAEINFDFKLSHYSPTWTFGCKFSH